MVYDVVTQLNPCVVVFVRQREIAHQLVLLILHGSFNEDIVSQVVASTFRFLKNEEFVCLELIFCELIPGWGDEGHKWSGS